MSEKNKEEKQNNSFILKKIKNKIDQLIDNGSTLDHAISVVCRVNGFNPNNIKKELIKVYNIEDKEEKKNYQDIKNDEGSYVMLKKNPGKEYEVININNKDNIVISDLDNDTELKVKEEEIIPIVTETKMNEKLNEAQYTVSIDNLETTDAETLSQMLSLAGQAEQPVATEMPMDTMAEPAPVMDYEPTIPSTMDGPGFEAAEVDSMPVDEFPSPAEEPTVDDMGYGVTVDDMPVVDAEDDVVLPAEETEIVGESLEEGCVKEDVLVPKSEEKEKSDATTAEEEFPKGKWSFYLNIFENIYQECNGNRDEIRDKIYTLRDEMGNLSDSEVEYIEDHFDELFSAAREDMDECGNSSLVKEDNMEEPTNYVSDDLDKQIAETLRLAGVQLDEVSEEIALAGKKDLPMPPIGKANPAAKENVRVQEPNYQEPATEKVMGYEATLGFENPANVGMGICVKETVNKDKIASILETAKRMYAKKDSSEWLALDRRYVEKLLKEGVGYTNASKMLLKAKAGK